MSSIVQNDTSPIIFALVLSSDHVSAATGKTATVTLSKNGGAFAAGGGTVTELSNGFYKYTPVSADVGTLGDLAIRATAASCDDWQDIRRVVQAGAAAADWTSARAGKIDTIDTNATAIKAKTDNLPTDPADQSLVIAATDAIAAAIGALNDVSAADFLDAVIETNGATTVTVKEALQIAASLPAGTIAGILSGAGAQTFTVKSASGQDFLSVAGDELGNRVVTRTPVV